MARYDTFLPLRTVSLYFLDLRQVSNFYDFRDLRKKFIISPAGNIFLSVDHKCLNEFFKM